MERECLDLKVFTSEHLLHVFTGMLLLMREVVDRLALVTNKILPAILNCPRNQLSVWATNHESRQGSAPLRATTR